MDVDEARRDGQAGGVDGTRRGPSRQPPHGDDPALADGDVAVEGGVAGAIHDPAAANQQIVILGRRERRQRQTAAGRFS